MVEENELRVGLSYYERAQVAAAAAAAGVFDSSADAIAGLFPTASKAKRSKIASFVKLHRALGDVLQFPWEIPERLGLQLTKALAMGQAEALRAAVIAAAAPDAAAEQAVLSRAMTRRRGPKRPHRAAHAAYASGIEVQFSRGTLRLKGPGVTKGLVRDLELWLAARHGGEPGPETES